MSAATGPTNPNQTPPPQKTWVGGPSFIVYLLPMMEYGSMYDNLNTSNVLKNGLVYTQPFFLTTVTTDQSMMNARDTLIPELTCPSNPNALYLNQTAGTGSRIALTNYKAMGTLNMLSLAFCLNNPAFQSTNPYGALVTPVVSSNHPDGACFPGKQNRIADFSDGTAHTILAAETMDFSGIPGTPSTACSPWFSGPAATLVGTPNPGTGGVAYQPANAAVTPTFPYIFPTGFNGKYDAEGGLQNLRTYLAYDFVNVDAGHYPDAESRPPAFRIYLLLEWRRWQLWAETRFSWYLQCIYLWPVLRTSVRC